MLPTLSDFGDLRDPDVKWAWTHFGNKTLAEAEVLFRENSIYYQKSLMWMGTKAFQFYFPSAVHYVYSAASTYDSDIISCLATLLKFRRDYEPESLPAISSTIISLCDYVLLNYPRFHIDEEIYGDLRSTYREIRKYAEQTQAI